MKTVLLIVVALGVVGAQLLSPTNPKFPSAITNILERVNLSFDKLKGMTRSEKVAHFRENCLASEYPRVAALDDDTILANLEAHLKAAKDTPGKLFQMGVNCITARSREDVLSTLKTTPPPAGSNRPTIPERSRRQAPALPASVDWRTKGYVNAVKNQAQCGSCWTFSANGAMEGAIFKKTGKLPNLSEQNLVDCVTASSGCNGGWMTDAYDYSIKNAGTDNQTSYPYIAKQNTACKYIASGNAGKVSSYAYTKQDDEADLKSKLATIGPIAVAIDASNIQNYVSGIYSCSNYTAVNHGVVAVGYGTDSATGTDYYIVRNSWGSGWGESGYMRIVRNKGSALSCGLPTYANYPVA